MTIKKLTLTNFRGFPTAELPLKPLTILLGPNSAGKSSFGHALAAMTHAHRVFSGTPQADLTPSLGTAGTWPIDLGSLDDLRTHGAEGPVKVGIETDAGTIQIGFGLGSNSSLLPSYFLYPKGEESTSTETGRLSVLSSQQPSEASPLVQTGVVGPKVVYETTYYEVRRLNELQWQEGRIPSVVILDGLLLKSITHQEGTPRLLSGKARDQLEFLFRTLTYLRASRHRPARTYGRGIPRTKSGQVLRTPGSPQEIGYAGEWAPAVLDRQAQEKVGYAELPKIPNSSDEAKDPSRSSSKPIESTLLEATVFWLQRLGLADSLRVVVSKNSPGRLEILVRLPNQQEHNLIEVGFGTSQVLPILVAGLLQVPGSLFVVDLPEAHLHPRAQAQVADFFCSLALSNRFCLIETHSEMFFHRLRLRAEMDEELRKNISVLFVDQPKNGYCCQPRPVGLGLDEQFEWPVGFLQEAWETEGQIELVRQSRAPLTKK